MYYIYICTLDVYIYYIHVYTLHIYIADAIYRHIDIYILYICTLDVPSPSSMKQELEGLNPQINASLVPFNIFKKTPGRIEGTIEDAKHSRYYHQGDL